MKHLHLILVLLLACSPPPLQLGQIAVEDPPDCGTAHDAAAADAPPDASPPDAPTDPCLNTNPPITYVDPGGHHANVTIQKASNYQATCETPRPLLLVLGGYGSNTGFGTQIYFGWRYLVQAANVLVLAPDGAIKPGTTNLHYWNADPSCCDTGNVGNDDVAYLRGLLQWAFANYNVNRHIVVVAGVSNGGFMVERMRCDASDLITTMIDLAGAGDTAGITCTTATPVAALVDHSLADTGIKYNGGLFGGMTVNYIPTLSPTPSTLDQNATLDGCTGLHLDTALAYDHDSAISGNDTDRYTYTSCTSGVVEHWRETNSVHGFAQTSTGTGVNTIQTIWGVDAWNFALAHPR